MPTAQQTVQNAYFVRDLDAAIERWHGLWGIGPFLVRRHVRLAEVTYHGGPARLDISAAYAQAGPIQIELVMQHGDDPSAFRDVFGPGQEGFHHAAMIPEDYAQAISSYRAQGFRVVTELTTAAGRRAAFIDTRSLLGHMLEVYSPSPGLIKLYRDVADAAAHWDRRQLRVEVDPA